MTVKKLASVQEQTRWILQKFIDLFSNLLQASTGHRKPPRGPQFAHPYLRQIIYVEEEEGWTLIVWVNYLMYYSRILIRCYEYIIKLFFLHHSRHRGNSIGLVIFSSSGSAVPEDANGVTITKWWALVTEQICVWEWKNSVLKLDFCVSARHRISI